MFAPFAPKVYVRFTHVYQSAMRRGKEFNLTPAHIKNLLDQNVCAYSGEQFFGEGDDKMTFERWDNDKGYVIGNVIPVKSKYNNMRGSYTLQEIINKANALSSKITVSADAKNHPLIKNPEQFEKLQKIEKSRAQIKLRLANRREHLKRFEGNELTTEDHEVIASIKSRIAGGENELKKLDAREAAIESSTPFKPSKADLQYMALSLIANSLSVLEKRKKLDMLKLKRGLPLTASLWQLIRGKM